MGSAPLWCFGEPKPPTNSTNYHWRKHQKFHPQWPVLWVGHVIFPMCIVAQADQQLIDRGLANKQRKLVRSPGYDRCRDCRIPARDQGYERSRDNQGASQSRASAHRRLASGNGVVRACVLGNSRGLRNGGKLLGRTPPFTSLGIFHTGRGRPHFRYYREPLEKGFTRNYACGTPKWRCAMLLSQPRSKLPGAVHTVCVICHE